MPLLSAALRDDFKRLGCPLFLDSVVSGRSVIRPGPFHKKCNKRRAVQLNFLFSTADINKLTTF
jgi:hypothetical protein